MTIAEEIEAHRNRVANGNGIGHVQLSRLLASHDRMVAVLRKIEDFASEGHEERYLYALDNIHE